MRCRTLTLSLLASVLALFTLELVGQPNDTIKIASWNILNLNADTSVEERADVISRFDIVALQEVESLEGLAQLRAAAENHTGAPWRVVFSPEVGEGQAAEHYAFIYRGDRVQIADGPYGVYPESDPDSFSREPFFATFRSGDFDFTLLTIHVTWGTSVGERREEVRCLKHVWLYLQALDPEEDDILLMGDFNLKNPTDAGFNELSQLGLTHLIVGDGEVFTTYGTSSQKVGANWYDNMWSDLTYTSHEYAQRSGVFYTHTQYYTDRPHPHMEVRTKISDHCPVWAEFHTTKGDDD